MKNINEMESRQVVATIFSSIFAIYLLSAVAILLLTLGITTTFSRYYGSLIYFYIRQRLSILVYSRQIFPLFLRLHLETSWELISTNTDLINPIQFIYYRKSILIELKCMTLPFCYFLFILLVLPFLIYMYVLVRNIGYIRHITSSYAYIIYPSIKY